MSDKKNHPIRCSQVRRVLLSILLLISGFQIAAQKMELVLPINNDDDIVSVQFSKDTRWAVTGCQDGEIRIWSVASGLMLRRFQSNAGTLSQATINSSGTFIIGTFGAGVAMWDVNSGIREWTFHSDQNLFSCLAVLSNNDKYVAFGDRTKIVTVLDALTGTVVRSFSGHKDGIASVCFSPDCRFVASTSRDGTLKLWNIETGDLVFSNHVDSNGMRASEFSSDGNRLITTSYDGSVHVWNVSGELLFKLGSHWQNNVHFNQDGSMIVSASGNNAYLWDGSNGDLIKTLESHSYWIEEVRFDVTGRRLVTSGRDSVVKVWDVGTGRVLFDFRKHQDIVWTVNFNSTGEYLISGSADETAIIWKLDKGVEMHVLTGQCVTIWDAQYASDGITMAHDYGKGVAVWDLQKGKINYILEDSSKWCIDFRFTPDGKRLVTIWSGGIFRLHDITNGRIIGETKCGKSVTGFSITTDGSLSFVSDMVGDIYLINTIDCSLETVIHTGYQGITDIYAEGQSKRLCIERMDNVCELWNYENQKRVADLPGHGHCIGDVQFLVKAGQVVTSSCGGTLRFWDVMTGKLLDSIESVGSFEMEINHAETMLTVYGLDTIHFIDLISRTEIATLGPAPIMFLIAHAGYFSQDDRYYICELDDSSIVVWDCILRKMEKRIPLGYNSAGVTYTHDESRIASVNPNGIIEVWNVNDEKLAYSLHVFRNGEYLILNTEHCYKSTNNVTRSLHYVTPDLRTISFEQLDVRFNRPHEILETMNSGEHELITSYRDAYYKRLSKLNVDTAAMGLKSQAPIAVSKNEVKYEQTNSHLVLQLSFYDSLVDLSTINIWINDCPVWGIRGVNISAKLTQKFDTTVTVELGKGINRIEVSVMNRGGIESYRSPVYVNYTPKKVLPPKTYFIGIGVDHFADSQYNLNWSTKDIRDQCAAMQKLYGDNFVLVDTLFNENVTVESVQALKAKLMNTTVNDRVIIAYSGHGLLSSNYDYYLSTYDVNFRKPEERGLAYEELENLVDSIPARQKLMLIDACHSGEVDKEEMLKLKKAESDTSLHLVANGKGIEVDAPDSSMTILGAQNSFELMSTLFVNVSRGTGTTIIAAASGTQFAYENGNFKNGVFTYCFLETMRTEKTCTVQQMKTKVSTRVTTLTNGLQRPTSRTETSGYDWVLW